MDTELAASNAWHAGPASDLSVVVPFYRYDVRPLAEKLIAEARAFRGQVELLFLDDGSPGRHDFESLAVLARASDVSICAGRLRANVGRSSIRNELLRIARAPSLVYLDADMWPDEADFIARYLAWAREGRPVVYGGRSARHATLTGPEHALHRQFTARRETIPAAIRRQSPVLQFYSCNFLVRRDVLATIPLDENFKGWGWEDNEWAARVADHHPISHEDNPASHLGLLTVDEILAKYDESPPNFKRMRALRPELVESTALFRAARLIRRTRMSAIASTLSRWIVRATWAPGELRLVGLMVYKAALYARHL